MDFKSVYDRVKNEPVITSEIKELFQKFLKFNEYDVQDLMFKLCKKGKLDMVKYFCEIGVRPTSKIFHFYVYESDYYMCEFLLKHGAVVNSNSVSFIAVTGYIDFLKLFIEHGLVFNEFNLHMALGKAILHKQFDMVDELLKSGADPNISLSLHYACTSDQDYIDKLIIYGADINLRNKNGKTPLMIASMCLKLHHVKKLLDWGANRYDVDNSQRTAADLCGKDFLTSYDEEMFNKISELLRIC